jgi:hypothetical protein
MFRKAARGSDEECKIATRYTNINNPERLESYFGREEYGVLVPGLLPPSSLDLRPRSLGGRSRNTWTLKAGEKGVSQVLFDREVGICCLLGPLCSFLNGESHFRTRRQDWEVEVECRGGLFAVKQCGNRGRV